jgi:REG-2-like HAD superfamily hydrolase
MQSVRYGAWLVDAAGTLMTLREPAGLTYARIGADYGVSRTPALIERDFRRALRAPWAGRRYDGDGRPFWRFVVGRATGCTDPEYFEAVYAAFGPGAWVLAAGALECIDQVRSSGVRVAVVSNWDHRLRSLLSTLGILERVDLAVISSEVRLEKPDPRIFGLATRRLGVEPRFTVHVGDSRADDIVCARTAGCDAWQYGRDVRSFAEIADRILSENGARS